MKAVLFTTFFTVCGTTLFAQTDTGRGGTHTYPNANSPASPNPPDLTQPTNPNAPVQTNPTKPSSSPVLQNSPTQTNPSQMNSNKMNQKDSTKNKSMKSGKMNKGAGNDKMVGKDSYGHQLYVEQSTGKKYYLNSSGNKVYVK